MKLSTENLRFDLMIVSVGVCLRHTFSELKLGLDPQKNTLYINNAN